jgi:ABC-2 type transport system permease protein
MIWKLLGASIRSQLQYPISFIILIFSQFLGTAIDILGIWVLFSRFHHIQGWSLAEVGIIYGIIQIGFALAETCTRGFDRFSQLVKKGEFDRFLLRPLSPLLQVAFHEFQLMRLGAFIQGLVVLSWSLIDLNIALSYGHYGLILFSILGTGALFYGLFVIQATLCFWTTESLEIMNIATYGGAQVGQYPFSIYPQGFRWFFTFVIPLACVANFPVSLILNKESFSMWGWISPFAGFLFLFLACRLWRFGINRYRSTGS